MAVEEAQVGTAKTSEALMCFPPHRRRNLKSETYRTLLRILSHCYDDSPPSLAPQNFDHNLNSENGSNELEQRTETQASQHVELVGSDSTEPKGSASEKVKEDKLSVYDNGFQDGRLIDQMAIDQIDQMMRLDENEDLSNQKDVSGSQDLGLGPGILLIDELESVVKGNQDVVHEINLKPFQNQSGIDEVVLTNSQEEPVDFKQIDIKASGNVSEKVLSLDNVAIGVSAITKENDENISSFLDTEVSDTGTIRQEKDMKLNTISAIGSNNSSIPNIEFGKTQSRGSRGLKFSEDSALSLDRTTVANISEASNKNKDQRSLESNALKVEHEMSLKDMEIEKPVCHDNLGDSVKEMMGDVDVEEGEISGGYSMDDIDMLLEDAVTLESKKVSEEPITDKEEFSCNVANERDFGSTFFLLDNNGGVGLRGSDEIKSVGTPDIIVNEKSLTASKVDADDSVPEAQKIGKECSDESNKLVLHEQSLEEYATRQHKISTSEPDAEVCVKKKRSRSSKEKRAKKKQKQRAEKNRQLGVKRLKLPLISKPKTISYCRHFMKGRCQEGDNCKFSHDTVPLTKSKPCCHFARHSCMKGDDCPFDHQLSKYPCTNFVSRGSCSRGGECMFSHKIVPKEDATTASNSMEPEKKIASLMSSSKSMEQPNDDGASHHPFNILSGSTGISSHKNAEKKVNETVLKHAKIVPKGTSFLTIGSKPLVDSNKHKQQMLSPNRIADAKVGNHIDQRDSGGVKNSNDILNKNPLVVAPKGINFLSFGRVSQSDFSCGRRLVGSPSNRDNGVKLSPSDNSDIHHQTSSAPLMLNGILPAVVPKGINFLSFGKSSSDDSCNKGKVKLPSNRENVTSGCVKEKQHTLDEQRHSSTTSSALPSCSVSLFQSPDPLSSSIHKNTAHSAQKALLSTLAFAAKYESQMKLNQSSRDPSVGSGINKEEKNNGLTGGAQNGLAKASKLLELLSSINSKSKQ